jgi:two-component system chemotaxis response regulator CheY
LLVNCGVKDIYEASDGIAALDSIRTVAPDVVILDWEMPLLSGPELVRIVRSPGVFPIPDVPIIILTGHCERWRVIEAVRLGVNEFLTKPVSAKALYDRLVSITTQPRPTVQLGDYYGPEPRKLVADVEGDDEAIATAVAAAVIS